MRLELSAAFRLVVFLSIGAAASAFAQNAYPSDPIPVGDRSTWVLWTDWPVDLYEQEIEGTISVELGIGIDGLVDTCRVTRSSGYAAMDEVACVRLTQRGRFKPARDASGRAVSGLYNTNVVFQFDDSGPPVPPPGTFSLEMIVEQDGTVSDCTSSGEGSEANEALPVCPDFIFEPVRDEEGNPLRVRVRLTATIEHQVLSN